MPNYTTPTGAVLKPSVAVFLTFIAFSEMDESP
jgi:hypothetical protein